MSIKTRLKNLEAAARTRREAERRAGRDYLEVVGELAVKAGFAEDPREKFFREHPDHPDAAVHK
ncbi:MAG: hypothetical protein LLF97_07035 [Planctomycetaceae bacterium]|nr:hypothetical protein [Planctomycetaceae bacterium]